MAKYISQGVFRLENDVSIVGYGSVVGKKEGEGPLGDCFDKVIEDSHFGQETWERAESRFQLEAVNTALNRSGLAKEQIDVICGGDLIDQCTASSYGLLELKIPFLGLYGACSTMAEAMLVSSIMLESGSARYAAAVTSSHFSTAERQFRGPLSYGGQRTPTSQWTCTASGSVILGEGGKVGIAGGCIGKMTDLGIKDITNMGAAMAPAAASAIKRYLTATKTSPEDYDIIVTGDLGTLGSELLIKLLNDEGICIERRHMDCGAIIFDSETQDTHCGGSGCGCSASVLCGYFLPMLERGEVKNILFAATGALMSVMSIQQGESIPAIAHVVHFRR